MGQIDSVWSVHGPDPAGGPNSACEVGRAESNQAARSGKGMWPSPDSARVAGIGGMVWPQPSHTELGNLAVGKGGEGEE